MRSLREDGQFVSIRSSIAGSESSREGGERGGEGGSGEVREVGEGVGAEEVLGKVTDVVKAVMELSNRVSLSPPDEYLELVKVLDHVMSHVTSHVTSCICFV